jgi:hypothetical protein
LQMQCIMPKKEYCQGELVEPDALNETRFYIRRGGDNFDNLTTSYNLQLVLFSTGKNILFIDVEQQ